MIYIYNTLNILNIIYYIQYLKYIYMLHTKYIHKKKSYIYIISYIYKYINCKCIM